MQFMFLHNPTPTESHISDHSVTTGVHYTCTVSRTYIALRLYLIRAYIRHSHPSFHRIMQPTPLLYMRGWFTGKQKKWFRATFLWCESSVIHYIFGVNLRKRHGFSGLAARWNLWLLAPGSRRATLHCVVKCGLRFVLSDEYDSINKSC